MGFFFGPYTRSKYYDAPMLVGSLDVDIRNLLVDFMEDHSFTFIFLYVHARVTCLTTRAW
jgi:hypothetical protein